MPVVGPAGAEISSKEKARATDGFKWSTTKKHG